MATLTNRLHNWPMGMLARHVWEYQDLGQTKNFKFWFIECCKKKSTWALLSSYHPGDVPGVLPLSVRPLNMA